MADNSFVRDAAPAPCDDDGLRDALPAYVHGRLAADDADRLRAHLAVCASCAAELALLRDARAMFAAAAPALDLDAIAGAVRAATAPAVSAPPASPVPAAPAATPPAVRAVQPRWAARGAAPARRASAWRLRVATVLLVLGGGSLAVWNARPDGVPPATTPPAPVAAAPAATAPSAVPNAPPAPRATVAEARPAAGPSLGARFDDLTDEELQAVIAAIDEQGAAVPLAEPVVGASGVPGGEGG